MTTVTTVPNRFNSLFSKQNVPTLSKYALFFTMGIVAHELYQRYKPSIKNLIKPRSNNQEQRFALIFHGGAGKMSLQQEALEARLQRLTKILEYAYALCQQAVSKNDLTALDIVEKVCIILEDDDSFNAGKGSVLTDEGEYELEASIMDGKTLKMGSVGLINKIKNPISLARDVMENTPHIALFGAGAQEYAQYRSPWKNKHVIVEENYYFQKDRYQSYLKSKEEYANSLKKNNTSNLNSGNLNVQQNNVRMHKSHANLLSNVDDETDEDEEQVGNTVGVCCMLNGDLAAATSTGGYHFKYKGRIGDSPLNGCGNYANNKTCAISGTGKGEEFMRHLACFNVHSRMDLKALTIQQAMDQMIQECFPPEMGGFVGVDANGNVGISFNSTGLLRGYVTTAMNGLGKVGVYKEERSINLN